MRITVNKSLLAIAVSGVLMSPVVHATNGYFAHGYSTKEKGLAGAGTAYSQDALASATNPAGMAFVGERMDVGASIFSPSRSYTVTGAPPIPGAANFDVLDGSGVCQTPHPQNPAVCAPPFSVNPGSVDSENEFFLIPHVAFSWALSNDSSYGVAVYGNGGMNTEYTGGSATLPDGNTPGLTITEKSGTFGAGTAGVNLEQLFINISFAKMMNDKHAFGASLILAGQRFAAQGLENFGQFSLDPDNLSGNRHSTSYGAGIKLGYQGEVQKGIRVGVSYQSKMTMTEFDGYKGLFAEGGDFDIPSTYNIGVAVDVGPSGMIVADIQRINYSEVGAVSNSISQLTNGSCSDQLNSTLNNGFTPTPASGAGCLGGASGAGFGWNDMTVIKIGYQLDVEDNTYRVGYSFTDQPIPESETLFNILAPAVIKNHFTAGLTKRLPGNQELNIAGMYAPSNSVKGANPFDGGQTQIEIEMSQWEIQAGWAWKY